MVLSFGETDEHLIFVEPDAETATELVIETVGGPDLVALLPALRPGGRMVLVGYVGGVVAELCEALVSESERLDATMIVVGNKRVQGIAGRVLGSIARDVAAHASCDVYVAHTHERK